MTPQPLALYLPTPQADPVKWRPEPYELPRRDMTVKRRATLLAQLLPPHGLKDLT